MRVLEPHHFHKNRPKSRKVFLRPKILVIIVGLAIILVLAYIYLKPFLDKKQNSNTANNSNQSTETTPQVLKQFTNDEFHNAYSSYTYPNTQPITSPPEITGNTEADVRIRKVAEARGYKLTALPVSSIVKTDEPGLEGDDLIQPNALVTWKAMKQAALNDGIKLRMSSAYRSIDYQRTLFLRRLEAAGVDVDRVLDGNADDEIDTVLTRAAPPGYSRHHTGFTIDLSCNGIGLEAFRGTVCYNWLSKNNFENVKKFGWIPSYPDTNSDTGPEPEPWEFIWIGTARTYQ